MIRKFWLMLSLLVLFILAPVLVGLSRGETKRPETTNINVFNTHGVGVLIETKCDFDYKTQNYKFYKRILIPKRSNRTISIPYGLRNCEVWVIKVILW